VVSVDDALRVIQPGQTVVIGMHGNIPATLCQAFGTRRQIAAHAAALLWDGDTLQPRSGGEFSTDGGNMACQTRAKEDV
jgi:hypothetical protein